jgi:hypothetical protein
MIYQIKLVFIENLPNGSCTGIVDMQARVTDVTELSGEFIVEFKAN